MPAPLPPESVLEYGRWRNARYLMIFPVGLLSYSVIAALFERRFALLVTLCYCVILSVAMAVNFWLEHRSPRRFELMDSDLVVRWMNRSQRIPLAVIEIRKHFLQDLLVGNAVRMEAPGVSFLVFRNLRGYAALLHAVREGRKIQGPSSELGAE